jgi:tetratricopeptide (TPR) repeat protein
MDAFAIDLESSRLFQEWYLREIDTGTTKSQIVEALKEVSSTTATIRALTVAYWDGPDYEGLSKQCLALGDPLAVESAKGFAVYRRSIEIMRQGGPQMHVRLSEMNGAIRAAQLLLSTLPQSDLAVEAQIGLLIPQCPILLFTGNHDEAIQIASQALFLAEQLQAPVTIARVRTQLIGCTANSGRVTATIEMIREERRQAFRYDPMYQDLELASGLFNLGNYEEASSVMQVLISNYEGERQVRALDSMQQTEAMWGIGGLEGPIYATSKGSFPSEWMTEVPRSLMRGYGTPREGKAAEERANHFLQAIEGCRRVGEPDDVCRRLFAQWATATAHLGRDEFTDAAGIIEHAEKVKPEWLDIRVLTLGAALDLSLSWQAPEGFSTARYEHLLREVFAEAARIKYASPAGLARLLHRWHPTAGAYMALAPNPVLACAFATRSVMKVGQYNYACDDLNIPPVLACDLMLRALDFDLRRDFAFVQGDAGASRVKRKELMQLSGTVPVWRLPVSAVKLAYGLMRHQSTDYHERARSVVQTYGIRPTTAALYPMIGVLDEVEQYTRELLDGHLTVKGFAAKMNSIRS